MQLNKKSLIILSILFVIGIGLFLMTFLSSTKTKSVQIAEKESVPKSDKQQSIGEATLQTEGLSAQDTTKNFYNYMLKNADDMKNGGYLYSDYLAPGFKEVIKALYDNGNKPILCTDNLMASIVVGDERQVYYDGEYLTQLVIKDAENVNKKLYRVLLQHYQSKWYVYDVNCIH